MGGRVREWGKRGRGCVRGVRRGGRVREWGKRCVRGVRGEGGRGRTRDGEVKEGAGVGQEEVGCGG